jgi:type I restriction enzyme, S subunit
LTEGVTAQLQEISRIIQGGRLRLSGKDFVPEGYPAYGAGGVNGFLPRYEFDEPAVVLSAIGARCGKCFYADGKWTSLANTQLIFPKPDCADPKFLWYQLNDERRWHRSGTGQPFIKPADVKAHRVFLPPLPEQRRLVGILDKADGLGVKRRTTLARLDALVRSVFLSMFGDPAANPKDWSVRSFAETMRDETSRSLKLQQSRFQPEGKYPVVDQGQTDVAGFCDDESYLCRSDLPVVVFGDHTRAVKLVRMPFVVGADGSRVLAPQDGVDATFLSWLLRLSRIPDLGYSRHMRELKRLRFPVPPIEMQHEFGLRHEAVVRSHKELTRALELTDALSSVLKERAFRGAL